MNGLSRAERLIHTSVHVTNFAKSWVVIFRAFRLCDGLMRARISSGYKPWRVFGELNRFSFNPQFNSENCLSLSPVELAEEWKCFMDRWAAVTLNNPLLEVIDTATMGLENTFLTHLHYLITVLVSRIYGC